jgi:hypothetical protein
VKRSLCIVIFVVVTEILNGQSFLKDVIGGYMKFNTNIISTNGNIRNKGLIINYPILKGCDEIHKNAENLVAEYKYKEDAYDDELIIRIFFSKNDDLENENQENESGRQYFCNLTGSNVDGFEMLDSQEVKYDGQDGKKIFYRITFSDNKNNKNGIVCLHKFIYEGIKIEFAVIYKGDKKETEEEFTANYKGFRTLNIFIGSGIFIEDKWN